MKFSTLFFTASLLVVASAQEGEDLTTFTSTDDLTTSTTESAESLVTLPPASCSNAGFDSCYDVLAILAPTVYVILTVDESTTIADAEPITSGDPILTQTDNILTATDGNMIVPTTAIVAVFYSESLGTTCGAATITSVLADDGDEECVRSSLAFFTPPDQVTKTRVFIKAREDDTQGKGTETGGGDNPTSPTPAPGSTSNDDFAAVTTTEASPTGGDDTPTEPVQTDSNPAPTTEDGSQPTEGPVVEPTEEPTEEPTGTNPTSTEDTPQETESTTDSSTLPLTDSTSSTPTLTENTSTTTDDSNTTLTDDLTTRTSGQESSSGPTTGAGQDESGKPEVRTEFTTIAEVSSGTTRFVTSAVATTTRSPIQPSSTSGAGSGAGPNLLVKAQVLVGALGLAAVVGL